MSVLIEYQCRGVRDTAFAGALKDVRVEAGADNSTNHRTYNRDPEVVVGGTVMQGVNYMPHELRRENQETTSNPLPIE